MTSQLMNHNEALKTLATERYLLREMNDEQRRDFEEHYLGCPECFEAVMFGSDFVTEMHNVALPAPAPGFREKLARFFASLMRPAPALAFAALLALVGLSTYQASVINHQQKLLAVAQAPRQESRFVIRGQSRSRASANVITLKRSDRLTLSIEFDPVPGLTSSRAELKSNSQESPIFIPVNLGPNDDSVVLSVPAAKLSSGSYSVVLSGQMQDGTSKELASGTVNLQVKD